MNCTHAKFVDPCGPYTVQLSMINPTEPFGDPSRAVKINVCGWEVSRLVAKNKTTLWVITSLYPFKVATMDPSNVTLKRPVDGPVTPLTMIDAPIYYQTLIR